MAGPDIGEPRNRETPRTQSPESVDVLGGLADIGAGVKEGITEVVASNTRKQFEEVPEEAAQEAAARLTQAQEVPASGEELTGDPEVDAVRARLGRLQAIVGATTGSARARAQLELRRVMADSAAKFPGLRDRLAAELRLFEATDPEYQALAMIDTQRELANKEAQAELDEIRDFAYSRAPDGLGLSPGLHTFGSKEFSAHLAYKGALIEEAQTRLLVLQDANTESMVTAESKAESALNFFNGAGAPYRQAIEAAAAQMWQAAEAARNITSTGASEQLLAWNQGGKQEVIANLQAVRADTVAKMSKLFSSRELATSETAKQAQAALEGELEALDQVMSALTGDETDWSVVKAYEAWNVTRQATFDSRFPAEANARLLLKNLVPFIDASDGAFGNVDAIAKNMLANYSIQTMNTVGGYLGITNLMSGDGMVGPQIGDNSPGQILNSLQGIRDDNMALLTNGNPGNLASQTQGHLYSQLSAGLKGVEVSPDMANKMTLAHTSAMLGVRNGPLYEDLTREQLLTLGEPEVLQRAQQAATFGNPNAGVALGMAAREVDLQYQPKREAAWQQALQAPLGGTTAQDVIKIDVDAIAQGKIQFFVDDTELATIAQTDDPLSGVGAVNMRRRALDQATKMSKQFTEDLRYLANMDALLSGENEPDYLATYRRHGFTDYLADVDE